MPWAAAIPAAISAAGSIAGAVSGGGGSTTTSGYTLPPELAIQMLNQFQSSLQNIQQQHQQNQQMYDLYNQRANVINSALSGSLPTEDAMKSLQMSSTQIAQAFGGDAMEAIKQGFLDKNSAEAAGLIKQQAGEYQNYSQGILDNLKQMESQDWVDPALKHQQEDQRRQLQQDLQRQGVSPAGQQAALTQFDRSSSDQLFSRSQDLKNQLTQRGQMQIGAAGSAFGQYASGISTAAGLQLQGQQQQFNQAQQGYQNLSGYLGSAQSGYAGLAGLQQGQFNVGQSYLQTSRQLNADTQNAFNEIGKYKLGGDAEAALKAGLAGNQTFAQQTGFARGGGNGGIKTYANNMENQQKNQIAAQNPMSQFISNTPMGAYNTYTNRYSSANPTLPQAQSLNIDRGNGQGTRTYGSPTYNYGRYFA